MLTGSGAVLANSYDLAMLDLDGVVYIGPDAVPGAPRAIAEARDLGLRFAFVTNNASRPAATVADHLTALGIATRAEDVVTSAQAAARMVADAHPLGAAVVCLGGEGLRVALSEAGMVPVGVDDDAVCVVSGFGPDVRWAEITRVAVRVAGGLPWIASNTDHTMPTPIGHAPGHGVLVDMMARFTGVDPEVAGKPSRPLLDETVRRVGGERALMVGDRLDTDIEGAHNAGVDALMVLTGVSGWPELVAAPSHQRPHHLAADLTGLLVEHPTPQRTEVGDSPGWCVGAWRAASVRGALVLESAGNANRAVEPMDAWRVAATVAWEHLDETGRPIDAAGITLPDPHATDR